MRRTSLIIRLLSMSAAGALLLATPATAGPTSTGSNTAGPDTLTELVTSKARASAADTAGPAVESWAGDAESKVTVLRSEPGWAFGTAVLVAPKEDGAFPVDWLFVAERGDQGWRIAFDGEPAFAELSGRSPVVSAGEKAVFASHDGSASTQANGDFRTGMRMPYGVGQSWTLSGGPHAYDAGSGPWSSVDLAGGDQRVLAARSGVAYTPCVGLVRVIHDRGYSTRYYHLWSHPWFNGSSVGVGQFLGNTGTEVGCGGSARARHVHFSLEQHGGFVGIAYHIIGKWVFRNGGAQYSGSALHGSTVRYVGSTLYNYGALGFTQGIVDTNGGGTVNKRSGPGTGYPVVGSVGDGATVSISCSRNGTTHTGRWGATALWNRLTDGTWVSDAFLYTGTNGTVNGYC